MDQSAAAVATSTSRFTVVNSSLNRAARNILFPPVTSLHFTLFTFCCSIVCCMFFFFFIFTNLIKKKTFRGLLCICLVGVQACEQWDQCKCKCVMWKWPLVVTNRKPQRCISWLQSLSAPQHFGIFRLIILVSPHATSLFWLTLTVLTAVVFSHYSIKSYCALPALY